MPRLSIWNSGFKGNDYRFFDRTISEYFGIGGTAVYVHLYLGPQQQAIPDDTTAVTNPGDYGDTDPDPLLGNASTTPGINSIEDVLFQENRDRKYSDTVYELRGIYTLADADFDLRQFGLFLQNDTYFLEFHLNDMIETLGRRLIPGDVLELPHQRDDTNPMGYPAMNKFYVVEDANRATDGYSATWFPHIWRVKITPMSSSQEFDDILDKNATDPLGLSQGKIGDLFQATGIQLGINQAVFDAAVANVPKRFFETQQFWMVGNDEGVDTNIPWLFTGGGDAIPPNGAVLVGSGTTYPASPNKGDYYLRTDYQPPTLFQWQGNRWSMQEVDWRGTQWNVAHRLLATFINNGTVTVMPDGLTIPEKTNISKAILARADF